MNSIRLADYYEASIFGRVFGCGLSLGLWFGRGPIFLRLFSFSAGIGGFWRGLEGTPGGLSDVFFGFFLFAGGGNIVLCPPGRSGG